MKRSEYERAKKRAIEFLERAHIVITDEEKNRIEVADFGLGKIDVFGLQILTYVSTERVCAKELILFPRQTCPEHRHPPFGGDLGKEETFRCRWGKVYLYVPGEPAENPKATVPEEKKKYFTVWHEIELNPGEQYTLYPNIPHWFQAGDEGAIVSEFSTRNSDEYDIFTDPEIRRIPVIEED
ncbi:MULTISPECIES: D-lyxose/D-mannose family sugar isomerase [Dictyoglomus]|uniref:D-lyxose ketol-isomerase n=1 Tax=Dictyoglomus turgidum (strain DSM 6724 / Z-1310) TaxID=515635 RepID=B8DZQ9_DICTD|nr:MULTISPECIES: D-lyxose/D-mannose family sugar isomerase [Dictyoglomus]ACK41992.1 YdaE [Dictyoglomus turgidum DSM 6724]HBU31448.1 D-lyxose/D-mannose family sugar isomerase [Dictyoglomus sp.]